MPLVAVPPQVRFTASAAPFPMLGRVSVKTIGSLPCSAPEASVAATATAGRSSFVIVTVPKPSARLRPGALVICTVNVSFCSKAVSPLTGTRIWALAEPIGMTTDPEEVPT